MKRKKSICIVTMPLGKSGIIPTSNLINIIKSLIGELYLITGDFGYEKFKSTNGIKVLKIDASKNRNNFFRPFRYLKIQIMISWQIFLIRKDISSVIFFIGSEGLLIPSFITKILRKKHLIILAGFPAQVNDIKKDPFSKVMEILSNLVFKVSDQIIVYSNRIIKERNLEKYGTKITIKKRHYINQGLFNVKRNYEDRDNLVGYIGTFVESKGIMNILRAIPKIKNERPDIKFIFIGDGPLKIKIHSFVQKHKLEKHLEVIEWIEHDDLPDYLNNLKLLVLPSYSEGLPNIIIEAMGCGTPVLVTPVGAIPDIIKDEESGFILRKNSVNGIKDDIYRALDFYYINNIIKESQSIINENFIYEKVKNNWKELIEELNEN